MQLPEYGCQFHVKENPEISCTKGSTVSGWPFIRFYLADFVTHKLIPYSGKLSREKTFTDWWKIKFRGENFRGCSLVHAPRRQLCVGVVTDCARVDRERVGSDKMSSYTVETVVQGYHMYKEVWDAAVGQVLPCQQECGSEVLVRSTLPFLLAKAGLLD